MITNEMWVAIIGALSASLGAIFSTISIISTNKNKKIIQNLENSNDVKRNISKKRYEAYNNIIEYINSWYNIEPYYKQDIFKCKAMRYFETIPFNHRLKSIKDLEKELNKVTRLTLEYFYIDCKTYKRLKSLEKYITTVLFTPNIKNLGKFEVLLYIVYCDIWKYLFQISKCVNSFIKAKDKLNFQHSKFIKAKEGEGFSKKTGFYCIFMKNRDKIDEYKELIKEWDNKVLNYDKKLKESKNELLNEKDKKTIKLHKKLIKIIKRDKRRILKHKKQLLHEKINIKNKTYNLWLACNNCNEKCIFNKNSNN